MTGQDDCAPMLLLLLRQDDILLYVNQNRVKSIEMKGDDCAHSRLHSTYLKVIYLFQFIMTE